MRITVETREPPPITRWQWAVLLVIGYVLESSLVWLIAGAIELAGCGHGGPITYCPQSARAVGGVGPGGRSENRCTIASTDPMFAPGECSIIGHGSAIERTERYAKASAQKASVDDGKRQCLPKRFFVWYDHEDGCSKDEFGWLCSTSSFGECFAETTSPAQP